jgi:hypothetical protein
MSRRARVGSAGDLKRELLILLNGFDQALETFDLREKVLALVPAVHVLRDLGVSVARDLGTSAQDRILSYFRRYPATVLAGDELGVVSGISEYARRIRELRVQAGWPIYSGTTAKQMVAAEQEDAEFGGALTRAAVEAMGPDDYALIGEQDREAAHRWLMANRIRRQTGSMRDKMLAYLRANVARPVTGEELRYVAGKGPEWARRVREMRTELGWPVSTRLSGRPDLAVGVYVLEADRQSPEHDRQIPDPVRVLVLERDGFACCSCGWTSSQQMAGDPRTLLELHHVEHHAAGGKNEESNLITLCNVHHDEVHRLNLTSYEDLRAWLSSGDRDP